MRTKGFCLTLLVLAQIHTSAWAEEPASVGKTELAVAQMGTGATDDLPPSAKKLSPSAQELIRCGGLTDEITRIVELRTDPKAANSPELLALKQEVFECVSLVGYQAKLSTNRIDREIATADRQRAVLADRRDRAVRLNTYANFISGGITGVIGGGMKIGNINELTPDIIDTVEGSIQTGLAVWGLQQQRGERKVERGLPSTLAVIFNAEKRPDSELFPDCVWSFLNQPGADGNSRRQQLVSRWNATGFCLRHRGHKGSVHDRVKRLASVHETDPVVTVDLLEDRIAMLYDLRSTVTQIDDYLMEVLLFVRTKQ